MSNISGRINLSALVHKVTKMKGKDGSEVEGVFIPFKINNLIRYEKGSIPLEVSCREYINSEKKQTHIVSQAVPKEVYEKLKTANEYPPTLGNLTDWGKLPGGSQESNNESADLSGITDSDGDLPF